MTVKENKLLASFLDWPLVEGNSYGTPFYQPYLSTGAGIQETHVFQPDNLRFHESWDWLVPVIKKILEVTFDDEGNETQDSDNYYEIVDNFPELNKTYKAVVAFIIEYNKSLKPSK